MAAEPFTQLVARFLRDSIAEGRFDAGSPIRQEAIARQFGISRLPVREALRQLESEGLVVIRPNSGARVAVLDFDECLEIYKIRERIEPLGFAESAERLTAEQLDDARRLALEVEPLTDDRDAWLAADRTLHVALYAGLPSTALRRMIVGLWNSTQPYRRALLTTFTEEDFDVQHDEHRLLVYSLATRNPRAGEEILRNHIERSRLRLMEHRDLFHA